MPDNSIYYHAAYVAAAIIFGAYAASVWWRGRRLRSVAPDGGHDSG